MGFQAEKQLVRDYYAKLDRAEGQDIAEVMQRYCASDYLWRGFHPFNEQTSTQAVAEGFWQPLRASLTRMQPVTMLVSVVNFGMPLSVVTRVSPLMTSCVVPLKATNISRALASSLGFPNL